MPGSHVYDTTWVAPRATRLFVNQLEALAYANRRYEREFEREMPVGDTVRVKKPQQHLIRDGFEYVGANINRQFTTIQATEKFGIDLEWDTVEKAVQMERSREEIEEQILRPAMKTLAAEADRRFLDFVRLHTPEVGGTLGTTPTSMATYNAAQTRIRELGGWVGARRKGMFLSPQMMETFIMNNNQVFGFFHPREEIDRGWKEGYINSYGGFDWYQSMSLPAHTSGVWGGAVTMNGANQSGISISVACTSGDTWKRGDSIRIATMNAVNPQTKQSTGRLKAFKIAADVMATSGTATLTLDGVGIVGPGSQYQNVSQLAASGQAVTQMHTLSGIFGAGVTDDAFALVAIDVPMPKTGTKELLDKYTDPETGVTIAIWSEWDFKFRKQMTRWDMWIGFGTLNPECAYLIAA